MDKHALHFTTEVGVARGVDDIDAVILPAQRGVLGGDSDAAFLFQIVRVHDARAHLLVGGEGAGLLEQLVDERGLAVVDVRDNGDVAELLDHKNVPGVWPAKRSRIIHELT